MGKKFIEEIKIDKMEFPNKGIGTYEGNRIEIKNALLGQKVKVEIVQKKGKLYGRILNITEKSPMETEKPCASYDFCGGCTFQSIPYENELEIKRNMVMDLFQKAGIKGDFDFEMCPAPSQSGYRNKMEFSFGDEEKGGALQLGMRKRNSNYEVAYAGCCNIVDEDYRKILDCVLAFFQKYQEPFYHKLRHEGALRHLVVRKGFNTGEILINLVTTDELRTDLNNLLAKILCIKLQGEVVGFLHTINNGVADTVTADAVKVLYGRDYFYDKLFGLKFRISPFSFFQTNTLGAEKLYATVKEFAGDLQGKIVFDLYCGTGTIAQILSPGAEHVYGIEIVEEAVVKAAENARMNGIDNCTFIAGDVLKKVPELTGKPPQLIILDPPRDGIHPKAIGSIIDFHAENIIYVSCKPSSLVRDLTIMIQGGYELKAIKLHDMFPRSYHVESVCLLTLKNKGL